MSKLQLRKFSDFSFGFLSASLERQLPKLRRKGYCCQCITHFGCCIKRKPRENIQVCVNVLPTSYRQVTDRLPTGYQHITNCRPTVGRQSADSRPTGSLYFGQNLSADSWPTVGRLSADSWPTVGQLSADIRPTVGRQLTDSRPTGFLGSSSSQLPWFGLPLREWSFSVASAHLQRWTSTSHQVCSCRTEKSFSHHR